MSNDQVKAVLSELVYANLDGFKTEGKKLDQFFYKTDSFGNVLRDDLGQAIVNTDILLSHPEDKALKAFVENLQLYPSKYEEALTSYSVVVTAENSSTGFYGATFYKVGANEVETVFRGTDDMPDAINDIQTFVGSMPSQLSDVQKLYADTKNFIKGYNDENEAKINGINLDGHSFGGGLAWLAGYMYYGEGLIKNITTFEEAGMKSVMDGLVQLVEDGFNYEGPWTQWVQNGEIPDSLIDMYDAYTGQSGEINSIARAIALSGDLVPFITDHTGTLIDLTKTDGLYVPGSLLEQTLKLHGIDVTALYVLDPETGHYKAGVINGENARSLILKMFPELSETPALLERFNRMFSGSELSVEQFNDFINNGALVMNTLKYATDQQWDMIMESANKYKSAEGTIVEPPRKDPILVDMDSDGLETISKEESTAYFDLDNDGTKEKVGWVKGDDGLLVRDVSKDGLINNGSELFGDQTIKSDGKKATSGYEALADLDSDKNGVLDSNDAAFGELKIWKDIDGDGVTDEGELQTLEEAGIKKIHLDYLVTNVDDGKGNIQTKTGGFEFADGRTGTIGEYQLNRDAIDTSDSDFSQVPEDILIMPYLRGFGQVTDLYHAMASDATLKTLVQNFCNLDLSDTQQLSTINSAFEAILFKWCGVDTINPTSRGANIDARKLAVLEKFFADDFLGYGTTGSGERSSNPNAAAAVQLNAVYNDIFSKFFANTLIQSHLKEYVMLGAIEFASDGTLKLNNQMTDFILNYQKQSENGSTLFSNKFSILADVLQRLGTDVEKADFYNYFGSKSDETYHNTIQTIATKYGITLGAGGNDTINGTSSNDVIYGLNGNDMINAGNGNNLLNGGKGDDYIAGGDDSDTYIYRKGDGNDTIQESTYYYTTGYDRVKFEDINSTDIYSMVKSGDDFIMTFKDENGNAGEKITFKSWFTSSYGLHNSKIEEFEFANGVKWDAGYVESHLTICGTNGNDTLVGSNFGETITGGKGDDTVNAGYGDDKIYGEAGNDTLKGEDGNDIIDGGKGDDYLAGGNENDTYIYHRGDGSDTIEEYDYIYDRTDTDKIKFEDINAEDVRFINREGDDIVIVFKDTAEVTGDQIRIKNWFRTDNGSGKSSGKYNRKIEEMEFADGTKWNTAYIETHCVFRGTSGGDFILGSDGNDILDGGKGKDYLYGSEGNDTYVYRRGDGNDVIFDQNYTDKNNKSFDKLKLEGINPSDIDRILCEDGDIVIVFKATEQFPEETITINYWTTSANKDYKIEEIEFADGTKWHPEDLEREVYGYGTDEDDYVNGTDANETITAGKGNDYIYGGEGSDTYVYRKGDGSDTIEEWNDTTSALHEKSFDKFKFEDINSSDIASVLRDGNDLIIVLKATETEQEQRVTFKWWFGGNSQINTSIEEIEFANGEKWNTSKITEIYTRTTETNVITGTEKGDWLEGDDRDDTIYGGKGDDTIYGWAGNNTLIGGEGEDWYIYNALYEGGNDVIYCDKLDGLQMENVSPEDVAKERIGNDLVLKVIFNGEFSGQVTLKDYYLSDEYKVDSIWFFPDTSDYDIYTEWTKEQIESNVTVITPIVSGTSGDDAVTGTAGDDLVESGTGNDTIDGKEGNDTINGGSGDDVVNGDEGNDKLYGGDGNDVLDGGKGDDYLDGGEGDDTYVYRRGDGNDVIEDRDDSSQNGLSYDKLTLEGINAEDVESIIREGNDIVLIFKDTAEFTGEQLRIRGWFRADRGDGDYAHNGSYDHKIEEIEFKDGTKWNPDYVESNCIIRGTAGDDNISGDSGNNVIEGKEGNDTLSGGEGNDTYIYRRGDGSDVIEDWNNKSQNGESYDKIKFKGINAEDVRDIVRDGNDIILIFKDTTEVTGDQLRIKDWYYSDDYDDYRIEEFEFADGTKWNPSYIESHFVIGGSDGNDTIYGTDGDDTILAGKGDDYLEGGEGNDTYVYRRGDGNDTIYDRNFIVFGNAKTFDKLKLEEINPSDIDRILTENGALIIVLKAMGQFPEERITIKDWCNSSEGWSDYKLEEIEFADGTKWGVKDIEREVYVYGTDGDDEIYGGDGNDTITAGKGNDYSNGWEGNDTYIYRKGDGSDTIEEWNEYQKNGKSFDKLKFEDINSSDVTSVLRDGNNLVIVLKATETQPEETITFKYWFFENDQLDSKVEEIEFANGEKWNTAQIEAGYKLAVTGTDGNDVLGGANSHGMVIDGKKGNDTITGSAQQDIYVVNPDSGDDVVTSTGGGEDIIKVNGSHENLELRTSNIDDMVLLMKSLNGNASLTLADYYDSQKHDAQKVKQIECSDGAILTEKNFQLMIQAMAGFETEKGITWQQGIAQQDPQAKEILAQFWTKKSEE